ncbi:MAG: Rnf-Nqr domain containing protein [Candidatus Enteromonas sp.]|nr:electron transport complex subunit RsxA [bacterium]MDD6917773.1 Rnf-Nqr domain containing protein [bacterium]MDY6101036.1 Rnf-Nqr domain containing protein [Candidatus Enteromonas sp.]
MSYFVSFLLAIVSAMLIDNVVLSRFYGICSFVGVSNKLKNAFSMGLAVTFVIVVAALICWPLYLLLELAGLSFLRTIVFILVIASLVQLIGFFIKKYSPSLYKALGIYLPLITTNCAVLGVVEENASQALDFGMSMANAIGTSLGFLFVIVLFSAIRIRIADTDTPKAFKGLPIALVTAALLAMAFTGLGGMVG